jgi:mRNA interferase MazF
LTIRVPGSLDRRLAAEALVQSDLFNETHSSLTVCPITTEVVDAGLFRVTLPPGDRTGLTSASQIMIDKMVSVPRSTVSRTIGWCDNEELQAVADALKRWLDL